MQASSTLAVLLFLASAAGAQWRTSVPITYNIDYRAPHVGSSEFIKKIADAPPQLLHVGEDVPVSSVLGTKRGPYAGNHSELISAGEVRAKISELKNYVASLRRAGVQWVIPYINNNEAFGDHVKREGIWQFFDHWERFSEFGFGPKPPEDMVTAQMQWPFHRLVRAKKGDLGFPFKRYQMCSNNPYWRQYLLGVTENIAKCGYDGTFIDVMSLRDYCEHCQAKFRTYTLRNYPESERRRRFGTADMGSLSLGHKGDGALWYDTQEFWAWSNADLLAAVRDEGRKTNPEFFVVPNYGPFANFEAVERRITSGKDPAPWAPVSELIMFEEWHRPGEFAEKSFVDYILQYKVAFALGFRAGILSYYAQEPVGIELSMAEAGAGGGGGLIQPYYNAPESRRKYRRFFGDHPDLFAGYESASEIAVLFAYDQLYWGNPSHLQSIYRLSQYLSGQHLTFDLLSPKSATASALSKYRAVVTPDLKYLPGSLLTDLRSYAERGGTWINIGDSGMFDDTGQLRPAEERRGGRGIFSYGSLNDLVPDPRFALHVLNEKQMESLPEMLSIRKAIQAGETPSRPHQITQDLRSVLGAVSPVVAAPRLEGLRCNVWRKAIGASQRVTAHFVNYYCPIPVNAKLGGPSGFDPGQPAAELAPKAVTGVQARLRVPAGRVTSVTAFDPDADSPVSLEHQQRGGFVEFTLPSVRIYKIVNVEISENN